jgi:hypothetical protein
LEATPVVSRDVSACSHLVEVSPQNLELISRS